MLLNLFINGFFPAVEFWKFIHTEINVFAFLKSQSKPRYFIFYSMLVCVQHQLGFWNFKELKICPLSKKANISQRTSDRLLAIVESDASATLDCMDKSPVLD